MGIFFRQEMQNGNQTRATREMDEQEPATNGQNQRDKRNREPLAQKESQIFNYSLPLFCYNQRQLWQGTKLAKMNNKIYINFETKSLKIKSLVSMSNYSF